MISIIIQRQLSPREVANDYYTTNRRKITFGPVSLDDLDYPLIDLAMSIGSLLRL